MSQMGIRHVEEPSEAVRAEAAAWIVRLHGPQRSPELEAGLQRWLSERAQHAIAFERMTEAWEDATNVATGYFPRLRVWKRPQRHAWKLAVAVLIVCGIGLFMRVSGNAYSTDVGEQRLVLLKDGSRVSLNSASRVAVEYSSTVRRLRLEKGEAFFEVNPDPQRPFIVSAGNRKVTALGTSFSVRYEPNRLAVVLVDGKVTVAPLSASGTPTQIPTSRVDEVTSQARSDSSGVVDTFTLSPGERLIFAQSRPPQFDKPRVDNVIAWRRGEVVLEKSALADAVDEMNRYERTQLVIDDPNIGKLRVSGVYRTGDSAGFARALQVVHDIEVVRKGDLIHLGPANAPPH